MSKTYETTAQFIARRNNDINRRKYLAERWGQVLAAPAPELTVADRDALAAAEIKRQRRATKRSKP